MNVSQSDKAAQRVRDQLGRMSPGRWVELDLTGAYEKLDGGKRLIVQGSGSGDIPMCTGYFQGSGNGFVALANSPAGLWPYYVDVKCVSGVRNTISAKSS